PQPHGLKMSVAGVAHNDVPAAANWACAAASAAASAAACSSGSLQDAEFSAQMRRIEAALQGAPKHIRIRGTAWAQRLGLLASVRQSEFRRDRNLHAELLLQCIEDGRWEEPMDKHPPEGPLPCLPAHVACRLRRQKTERTDLVRHVGLAWTSSAGSEPLVRSLSQSAISQQQQKQQQQQQQQQQQSPGTQTRPARATTPRRPFSRDSRSGHSLAGAAAAAVGVRVAETCQTDGKGPSVTIAAPSAAYSALAARVSHLEEMNRRLRRQLGSEAVAFAKQAAGAGAAQTIRLAPKVIAISSRICRLLATTSLCGVVAISKGLLLSPIASRRSEPDAGKAFAPWTTTRFLRYLDDFQDYAGSLVGSASAGGVQ
ncbi:unnamed protein product, partial [Polarella glacialis]